ncbi:hypothetical protein EGW08_003494 [Elysia chlorotica]|uniref:Uncharacterized protein n=1 Tax=Elysia chlorotica TaxID=188477 RepID=A0A433U4L4_ELYCH|nr:hypothetical protein EGW08_003494 [Elysia chlorotica]
MDERGPLTSITRERLSPQETGLLMRHEARSEGQCWSTREKITDPWSCPAILLQHFRSIPARLGMHVWCTGLNRPVSRESEQWGRGSNADWAEQACMCAFRGPELLSSAIAIAIAIRIRSPIFTTIKYQISLALHWFESAREQEGRTNVPSITSSDISHAASMARNRKLVRDDGRPGNSGIIWLVRHNSEWEEHGHPLEEDEYQHKSKAKANKPGRLVSQSKRPITRQCAPPGSSAEGDQESDRVPLFTEGQVQPTRACFGGLSMGFRPGVWVSGPLCTVYIPHTIQTLSPVDTPHKIHCTGFWFIQLYFNG